MKYWQSQSIRTFAVLIYETVRIGDYHFIDFETEGALPESSDHSRQTNKDS